MARLQLTSSPILQHPSQLLILPVNSTGIILDPVIARCKTLYPDNYQRYRRACQDGSLMVGSSLLVRRQRDHIGLAVSSNGNRPSHIVNLVICDHPYHPPRKLWLSTAVEALREQLYELMRYEGLRTVSLLARPLIYPTDTTNETYSDESALGNDLTAAASSAPKLPVLQWQTDILPLLTNKLANLPKLRLSIHVPKSSGPHT